MPVIAASRMAAQVTSKRSADADWTTTRPMTVDEPPKYSPTMAPMRLSVVATFSAVRKNGSAFGSRTLRRIVQSEAAYERISSSADGSTWVRPRVTLIMIGKKTSSAAIIIFESGLVTPNQALKIGAMAMIGMALAATANGSTASRALAQRATPKATTTPTDRKSTRLNSSHLVNAYAVFRLQKNK